MKRRGLGVVVLTALFAGLVSVTPAMACEPRPKCVIDWGGPEKISIPSGAPVMTVLTGPPTALAPDAFGAPSQPPVKTDGTIVTAVQPAYNVKHQSGVQAQSTVCDEPRWHYDISGGEKRKFYGGRNDEVVYRNPSDATAHYSVSYTTSGHIGVTASASVEVSSGVILASVKGTFGLAVQADISWEETITYGFDVPPGKSVAAAAGVERVVVTGRYYYTDKWCQKTVDKGMVTTYSPHRRTYVTRNL